MSTKTLAELMAERFKLRLQLNKATTEESRQEILSQLSEVDSQINRIKTPQS